MAARFLLVTLALAAADDLGGSLGDALGDLGEVGLGGGAEVGSGEVSPPPSPKPEPPPPPLPAVPPPPPLPAVPPLPSSPPAPPGSAYEPALVTTMLFNIGTTETAFKAGKAAFDTKLKLEIGCGVGCDFTSSYSESDTNSTALLMALSTGLDVAAVAVVLNSTSGFDGTVGAKAEAFSLEPIANLTASLGFNVISASAFTVQEEYPVVQSSSSSNVGLICGLAIGLPLGLAAVGGGAYMYKKRQGGISGSSSLTIPIVDERD